LDVPQKYKKYFGEKKTKDLNNFIKLKRHFIDITREKKWFKKNDTLLIDLPADLRKELNLPNVGYVKFTEIEKIIFMFFNA
jgi:hypothetical protein